MAMAIAYRPCVGLEYSPRIGLEWSMYGLNAVAELGTATGRRVEATDVARRGSAVGRDCSKLCSTASQHRRSFLDGASLLRWSVERNHKAFQSCSAALTDATPTAEREQIVPEKSVSVILLAGGKGKRMGANMPKQYLPLLGQPIALYSFYTFANMVEISEIIVVCDPSYRYLFEEAKISIPIKFALPGKERQDSVRSGLQEISESSKLACIHDSARPLVQPKDILKVLKDGWATGAAVLGVPVKATIKEAGCNLLVAKTLNRSKLWEMQTPQVIEPKLLLKGFELVEREGLEVTDDVSIVEYLKHPVLITEGSYTNLKVTTVDDLLVAERILHQSNN